MSRSPTLLPRLIALHVVWFGVTAINTAWAEDAASVSTFSGKNASSSDSGATTDGDKFSGDKVDSRGGDAGSSSAGSTNGGKHGAENDGKGTAHGDADIQGKPNRMESNPIDTRITVMGKSKSARMLSAHDRNSHNNDSDHKKKIARSLGASADNRRTLSRINKDHVVRNAIGQQVNQNNANGKGIDSKAFETTAVEGAGKKSPGAVGSGGADGLPVRRGFVFVPAPVRSGAPHDRPLNVATNHSIINGTGMSRPAVRVGAIGGTTTKLSGVLNGTDFRPRHP